MSRPTSKASCSRAVGVPTTRMRRVIWLENPESPGPQGIERRSFHQSAQYKRAPTLNAIAEAMADPSVPNAGAPQWPKIRIQSPTMLMRLMMTPMSRGVRTSPTPRSALENAIPTENGTLAHSRISR